MTRPKPFLYAVAEAYVAQESRRLLDYCFIFPNKRSATFFTDYMERISRSSGKEVQFIPPVTTTIVEFEEGFGQTCQIERMEAVFMLFSEYRKTVRALRGDSEAEALDFNRFVYWADILLNDFDDVDNSMVSPEEIFRNVENLKEISSNYLTPEQIEVIKQYWSDDRVPQDVQQFWNHVAHPSASGSGATVSVGFLRLWQVMKELYTGFRRRLADAGMHTSGMAARHAAERIAEMAPEEFFYRRYVFVGFNNLSRCERTIMARLSELRDGETGSPMADFYWDLASPILSSGDSSAARLVQRYAKAFPSLYPCVAPLTTFPKIEITGVPSRVAQANMMGQVLNSAFPLPEKGSEDKSVNQEELRRTAIILPDENLLTPLLDSIPAHVSPLNITMGYKLRNTAVAGLIRDIVSMQLRAYSSAKSRTFFFEDVNKVLSNPLVRLSRPLLCVKALEEIQLNRYFSVPESMFMQEQYSGLRPVFEIVADKKSTEEVFRYLDRLLEWIDMAVAEFAKSRQQHSGSPVASAVADSDQETDQTETRVDGSSENNVALQKAFLLRYRNALRTLHNLIHEYLPAGRIFIEDATLFNLIERLTAGEMLNFSGMPLKGLQIMGVLEARSLDFDTLILPSMNERIFPKSKFNSSFIPTVLRKAYGLPTAEDQEHAFSYFFYRMISRARRVVVLYDARTSGTKSAQMSRYVSQLIHLYRPKGMQMQVVPLRISTSEKPTFRVEKTERIMEELNKYRIPGSGRFLSASSIKKYLSCPMSFYLEKIARFKEEDEMRDWLDEGTFGTIVHEVFEKLYDAELQRSPGGAQITEQTLTGMIQNTATMGREIEAAIRRHYLKLPEGDQSPLPGDARIYSYLIATMVTRVLQREKDCAPFTYLRGEMDTNLHLNLKGSEGKQMSINFTARIDRIDHCADSSGFDRIRIIDYKTGSDSTSAKDMEAVFHDYKTKAFMQLMLYCQTYAQSAGYNGPIQPLIFPMRDLMVQPIAPLKISEPLNSDAIAFRELKAPARKNGKWKLADYRDYVTEFNDALLEVLEGMFDPDKPFECTDNTDDCKYCQFKELCQTEDRK